MPAKSTGKAKAKKAKKDVKKTTKKAAAAAKKKTRAKSTIKKAAKAKSTPKATKAAKKAAPKVKAAAVKQPAATTKRAAPQKVDVARVRVRQIRSSIGRRKDFRQTLRALGIRHHQGEVVVTRNPAINGMLAKVSHLIRVTPEE